MGRDGEEGPRPPKRIKLEDSTASTLTEIFSHLDTLSQDQAGSAVQGGTPALITLPMAGKCKVTRDEQAQEYIGSSGQIRRTEYIRLITQSLYELGYETTAAQLERESGVLLQLPSVAEFRKGILDGNWEDCATLLQGMNLDDEDVHKSALFSILEQKYLELLETGQVTKALKVLQGQIEPLKLYKDRLHELATFVMCVEPKDLRKTAGWSGAEGGSRRQLLTQLEAILPSTIMVPERRLEGLLEQALRVQRANCYLHNTREKAFCLFADHSCGRDQIPRETVQVLEDHTNEVWYLQFSHDGKRLASASMDKTAIIWEVVEEDKLVVQHRLVGHDQELSYLAWSPDDSLMLTCSSDKKVKLWDTKTGECRRTFGRHTELVLACAWFPDGQNFVTGGNDCRMCMWNLEGTLLFEWAGGKNTVTDLTVSHDGKLLVSVWASKEIHIYSLEDKTERHIEETDAVTSLALSNDGRYLLLNLKCDPPQIQLLDIGDPSAPLSTRKLPELPLYKYTGHRQGRFVIRSCFGGSDQAFIVSGSEDSQVYIWQRESEELLEVLEGHAGTVNTVCWNPTNPHMFASASDDHTVRIWGLAKKKRKSPLLLRNGVESSLANGHTINHAH
eukprot:TRINITY_DN17460_c0_g1_i1.p1 TRINITY_DN17460_c0_g1~~TRINITY_DN17460_c0_g1_i1.p1  ORF type:complete len:617 (+),score=102.56 TRINITY_DN17460_c0_g1_i1:313-2163(+)